MFARTGGKKQQVLNALTVVGIFALVFTGCSKNDTLTAYKVQQIVELQINKVEYRAYISIGERIGATAGDPEKFLKNLGLVDYVIKEEQHTWYVKTSLTEQGKKLFKAENTIWGPRYAAPVAKLKIDKVTNISLSPDNNSAIAELTLKVQPFNSTLGQQLNPEKSVFANHNIYIQCTDVTGKDDDLWSTPKGRPYKVQLLKQKNDWVFAKIVEH